MLIILLSLFILPYATPLTFNLKDISPWNQNRDIVTEGDGAYISSQGIQVTPDEIGSDQRRRAGRATYITPLHLWDKASGQLADFDTYFSFVIDSRGSAVHGDGLTFFLAQNNSVISSGAAIGLPTNGTTDQGSNQYVAVEFDTYYNWEWDPVEFGNVSTGEHVGIDINSLISGNLSMSEHVGIDINSLISVEHIQWKNLSNGRLCEARVSYDSVSKNLSVTVTSSEDNSTVRRSGLHHIVDLRTQLPERVIFGFTAATGGYFEKNNVKSWSFNSSDLLSDRNQSLAPTSSPNPAGNGVPTASPASPSPNQGEGKSSRKGMVVGLRVGGVLVLVLVFAVTAYVFLKGRKEEEADDELALDVGELDTEFAMGSGPKRFSYNDLSRTTNNFAEGEKLGEGGFGGVYRGFLRELSSYVAVKRVSKTSSQGIKEYASEVKIISRLRHRNLVKLIGWCHEKGELLLVYDYMENGSLDSHLFKAKSLLPWQVRYKIAQGLASALLYLHEEWEQCVLHRDIKPSNIMLDSNFIAKLGDFGLAKLVDHERGSKTTIVAGTRGYMAPEYIGTGKASKESDVFSFGVVMLELVCGTTAMRAKSEEDQLTLVEWVWQLYGMGKLQEAVDPKLGSNFDEKECVYLMIIGLWCAHPDSTLRPSMKQVINVLNFEAPLPPLPSKMPVATYFIPPTSSFPTNSYEAVSTKIVAASDPSVSLLYTGRIDANDINQKMRTI